MKKIRENLPVYALSHDEVGKAISEYAARALGLSGKHDSNVRCDAVTTVPVTPPPAVVVTVSIVPSGQALPRITDGDVLKALDALHDSHD